MAFLKRRIFQGLGAVLPNAYVQGFLGPSLYQGPLKGVCTPMFNCYACPSALFSCPIGSMQHFAATGKVPFYAFGTMAVGGYPPGDGELARVIEDLVKEMKKGNGRTEISPR